MSSCHRLTPSRTTAQQTLAVVPLDSSLPAYIAPLRHSLVGQAFQTVVRIEDTSPSNCWVWHTSLHDWTYGRRLVH